MKTSVVLLSLLLLLLFLASKSPIMRERAWSDEFGILMGSINWGYDSNGWIKIYPLQKKMALSFPVFMYGDLLKLLQTSAADGVLHYTRVKVTYTSLGWPSWAYMSRTAVFIACGKQSSVDFREWSLMCLVYSGSEIRRHDSENLPHFLPLQIFGSVKSWSALVLTTVFNRVKSFPHWAHLDSWGRPLLPSSTEWDGRPGESKEEEEEVVAQENHRLVLLSEHGINPNQNSSSSRL